MTEINDNDFCAYDTGFTVDQSWSKARRYGEGRRGGVIGHDTGKSTSVR